MSSAPFPAGCPPGCRCTRRTDHPSAAARPCPARGPDVDASLLVVVVQSSLPLDVGTMLPSPETHQQRLRPAAAIRNDAWTGAPRTPRSTLLVSGRFEDARARQRESRRLPGERLTQLGTACFALGSAGHGRICHISHACPCEQVARCLRIAILPVIAHSRIAA